MAASGEDSEIVQWQQRHRTRRAILIGEEHYLPPNTPLPGTAKDVDSIHKTMLQMGFEPGNIRVLKNASREDMTVAVESTAKQMLASKDGDDIVFFYFAGHGGESGGDNDLCDVAGQTLRLYGDVLSRLDRAGKAALIIVFLDCCRYNPSNTAFEVLSRGGGTASEDADRFMRNARVATGRNKYILCFACDPGRYAYSTQQGGFFSSALLEHMQKPLLLETMCKRVVRSLELKYKQRAWVNMGGYSDDFSLSWTPPTIVHALDKAPPRPSTPPTPAKKDHNVTPDKPVTVPKLIKVVESRPTEWLSGHNPELKQVALGGQGSCYIQFKSALYDHRGLPPTLVAELRTRDACSASKRARFVSFLAKEQTWAVVYNDNTTKTAILPTCKINLFSVMEGWYKYGSGYHVSKIMLGPNNSFVITLIKEVDGVATWHTHNHSLMPAASKYFATIAEETAVTSAALWGNGDYWFRSNWKKPPHSGGYGHGHCITPGTPAAIAFAEDKTRYAEEVVGSPGDDNAIFVLCSDGHWFLRGPPDLLVNFQSCITACQRVHDSSKSKLLTRAEIAALLS